MTEEQLTIKETRARNATPGPFHWVQIGTGPCDSPWMALDGKPATRADQALFAKAQVDVAELCAEVRRLRYALEAIGLKVKE